MNRQTSIWDYLGLLTILGAIVTLIYVVVDSLRRQDATWPLVAFILLLTGMLLADKIIDLYFRVRDRIDARQAQRTITQGEVIDARYSVDTRAPQAALPAPITVQAVRYTDRGVVRPMGAAPAQPPVQVETVTEAGETLTVPLIRLQRFLSLPTPSRTEWVGNRELYSQCAQFCLAHGLLNQDKRGGYKWVSDYDREARAQWAMQFDPSPTNRPGRVIGSRPVTADE